MKLKNNNFNYEMDEFGRIIIKDEQILRMISGTNKNRTESTEIHKLNLGCGLNKVCANKDCAKYPL